MFLEMIAVFVAGFAGAGVMLILGKVTGGRLPRWMIPVGAGLAMLGTAISSEYGWYGRTAGALPDGMVVADSGDSRAFWRPWTYLVPMTDRFVAVDTSDLVANTETEGLYMAEVYFFGRWQAVQSVQIMVDCPGARRADPALGDGSPPVWRDVDADDPLVATICAAI